MLTNFFSKTKPITIVIILALFLSYYGIALLNKVSGVYDFKVVPLFLITIGLVSFIDVKNELTFDNTYAVLFFVTLLGIFPSILKIDIIFYSNFTLLLFLRKVYSLQSSKKFLKKLFDSGLWLGITFLMQPFCALFFVLLFTSIIFHQKLTLRALFIPLVGFITPLFLYFTYCFWHDNLPVFYGLFLWEIAPALSVFLSTPFLIGLVFTLFLALLAIILKTPKTLSILNVFRKSWMLLLLNFVSALFLVFLIGDQSGNELLYVTFPISVILANGLELFEKKWFVDIVTISFLVFPLVNFFV